MSSGLRQRRGAAPPAGALGSMLASVRGLDAYAKPMEDFRIKTFSGGAVTIASAFIIAYLVLTEFADYRATQYLPSLRVDPSTSGKMEIFLNVTFPQLPCYLVGVDVMDVAGEHLHDINHDIFKVRLDADGRPIVEEKGQLGPSDHDRKQAEIAQAHRDAPSNSVGNATAPAGNATAQNNPGCGSCYGAQESPASCCNSCDDVRRAYASKGWTMPSPDTIAQCVREHYVEKVAGQRDEGCLVHGTLVVNRVPGNVHFAPGASFQQMHMHVHDLSPFMANERFRFAHIVNELRFGTMFGGMRGVQNPLDGHARIVSDRFLMFQYYLKVVSTRVEYLNGTVYHSNQYSVTEHTRDVTPRPGQGTNGLPGVFLNYDISPMQVTYREAKKPLSHFLTDVCAIVGGIFTVAGLLDGFLYTAERVVKQKVELGKAA